MKTNTLVSLEMNHNKSLICQERFSQNYKWFTQTTVYPNHKSYTDVQRKFWKKGGEEANINFNKNQFVYIWFKIIHSRSFALYLHFYPAFGSITYC